MEPEIHILDTETAGFEGGVCDIAIRCIDKDFNILWEKESLTDPERPISPGASGIHGITDDMVADKPTMREWCDLEGEPWRGKDLVIVGHNIQFDIKMLLAELPDTGFRRLCTMKLAKLLWPDAENFKLQTLRYAYGLEAGTAHRAMGDVVTCYSMLKLAGQQLGKDFWGLMDYARQPLDPGKVKMPFGKHAGVLLKNLDRGYVAWSLKNMTNLDPDLKECLQRLQTV